MSQVWTQGNMREVTVEEGGRASLVCEAEEPWLVCTWHHLQHHLQHHHCALLTQDQVRPVDCQGGEEEEEEAGLGGEVEVVGNRSWCGLNVSGGRREPHSGLWTCSLASLQAGRLVSSHSQEFSLEVFTRGSLRLVVETNNNNLHYLVSPTQFLWSLLRVSLQNSTNVLHGLTISSGGIINISCHLENAFPQPSFSWRSQARNNDSADNGIILSPTVRTD